MNNYQRYVFNQHSKNEARKLVERIRDEQKSSSKSTQERKEDQAQSGSETSKDVSKRFDDYHYEEEQLCIMLEKC